MIRQFLREHLIWYILYIMMFVLFFISFYLYHLPMPYLFNSLGLNVIVLLGISIWQYSRYRKKMLHLKYFNSSQDPSFELQPSDYAYFNIITQLEAREAQKVSETIEQTNHVALMIKMWSHQMKVPLAAISLMAQTNHLDPKEVEQQLLKLQHYLETLLAFLKFRQYRDDFRFEAVSLREVVVEIIKSYKVICLSKSLSIIIEGDNIWKTDKKWLTLIIISIGEESIRIQDYGIGILEEDIPRLFEDGFTGYNGHEHQKATGMGLYMTKEVLSSLNLSISVDSKINYGTAVSIHK
ncbi:TPA: sensor histidine kinase [Streptococcus agalactiae]|nr:sensor histidine kinase [Streptococcus agalactiae]